MSWSCRIKPCTWETTAFSSLDEYMEHIRTCHQAYQEGTPYQGTEPRGIFMAAPEGVYVREKGE